MPSASVAFSRGLPKSRTAPWDSYISEAPSGKGAARDSSCEVQHPGEARAIFDQALLFRLVFFEPMPRRQIREASIARPPTSI